MIFVCLITEKNEKNPQIYKYALFASLWSVFSDWFVRDISTRILSGLFSAVSPEPLALVSVHCVTCKYLAGGHSRRCGGWQSSVTTALRRRKHSRPCPWWLLDSGHTLFQCCIFVDHFFVLQAPQSDRQCPILGKQTEDWELGRPRR